MSVLFADRDSTGAAGAARDEDAHAGASDPASRGALTIADRVVQKVAAQAVTEVDRATGAPRLVLGQRLGAARPNAPARTDAQVDGHLVTVRVSLAVEWPAPVREVAAQVRRHVTHRVLELTGLDVVEVDVDVPALLTTRHAAPRRWSR